MSVRRGLLLLLVCLTSLAAPLCGETIVAGRLVGAEALCAAIHDLAATFGPRYTGAAEFLAALGDLQPEPTTPRPTNWTRYVPNSRPSIVAHCWPIRSYRSTRSCTSSAAQYRPDHHATETMFQNDECNTNSFVGSAAIKSIHLGTGDVRTVLTVPHGIARDIELDFDGCTMVFAMRQDVQDDYHIYTIRVDGSELRQLTHGREVSDIDPMFLPDGDIVMTSSREPKYCHCNRHIMCNLFRMGPAGEHLVQIGHNILFEGHPSLMPDGRILYDRWEYVDRHFGPSFGLWTVNPDGTSHSLFYGNNAWAPGAIMDARVIPGTEKVIATFGSCHDRPWGAIAIVNRGRGLDGSEPVEAASGQPSPPFSGRSRNAEWNPGGIDLFSQLPLKAEDPYPLSDKYFLWRG